MIVLWVLVSVLSVVMVVCLLALTDQYRTLEVIRTKLKLEDNPEPLAIHRDRPIAPSAIGLPRQLDDHPHLVVLFLSTSCTTCRSIAQSIHGKTWGNIWVVLVQAGTPDEADRWLADAGVPPTSTTVDYDGRITDTLGVTATPSAVLYSNGDALVAQTIPSYRQLTPLLAHGAPDRLTQFAAEGTTRP